MTLSRAACSLINFLSSGSWSVWNTGTPNTAKHTLGNSKEASCHAGKHKVAKSSPSGSGNQLRDDVDFADGGTGPAELRRLAVLLRRRRYRTDISYSRALRHKVRGL